MKVFFAIAAVLLFTGAGCDLNSKISLRWPFELSKPPAADHSAAALSLRSEAGTRLTIQPSFLGVTGTIADIVGSEKGMKTATVKAFEAGVRAEMEWSEKADPEKRGTVAAAAYEDAHEMFLPAFWKPGDQTATNTSLIWLSPEAWRELKDTGSTEWRLGLGGEASVSAALKALRTFNDLAAKLSGGSADSVTSSSPFRLNASKQLLSFPLRVDGKLKSVRVLKAASWFADYIILENADNPLILKVNVNPAAVGALASLKPLGVDIAALGYEITEIESANP